MTHYYKSLYGPIPSRRLGQSLGISPILKKTCNYACIYCMLGPTDRMTNELVNDIPVETILDELDHFLNQNVDFDVVSIVGEGEPTLYRDLILLIEGIRARTEKPIALITNGALLNHPPVYQACLLVDIMMPSVNAYDLATFKKINRPHKDIDFMQITESLIQFSQQFTGQLWLECMLVEGVNDSTQYLVAYREFLKPIKYDRLYINTPVRPPTESYAQRISSAKMQEAITVLNGIGIEDNQDNYYYSDIEDNIEALYNIIRRHPMNHFEITHFLQNRQCANIEEVFSSLQNNPQINIILYRGLTTYRFK